MQVQEKRLLVRPFSTGKRIKKDKSGNAASFKFSSHARGVREIPAFSVVQLFVSCQTGLS